MARLDELDLSLKLSKEEEAERLDAGWKRLAALRLALGGKLPGYDLGPPLLVLFEGLAEVMDESGVPQGYEHTVEVSDADAELIEEAVESCPARAISISA